VLLFSGEKIKASETVAEVKRICRDMLRTDGGLVVEFCYKAGGMDVSSESHDFSNSFTFLKN
jgi:hypothetical protein